MIVSLLLIVFFPLGLAIYFYKRKKISIKAIVIGILTFFISQIVLRLPALTLLSKTSWYSNMAESHFILLSLILAITAGIFEELGRYIGFRFLLKNKLEWKNGVAAGIGHGGIEALLIVGVSYLSNLIYSLMINSGVFATTLALKLPATTVKIIEETLINTPSHIFLLGGLERILTMNIHIAYSIVVLYGVMSKQFRYIIYAILMHGLLDIPAAFYQLKSLNIWAIEVLNLAVAIGSVIFVIKMEDVFKKKFKDYSNYKI